MRLPALAALLLYGSAGWAYVRSTSPRSGAPFTWMTGCINIRPDIRGSQDVSIDKIETTLRRATTNWTMLTDACGNLRLSALTATQEEEVGADGRPILVFRDVSWRRPGGMMHDPSAIALTTVFHVSTPGRFGDGTILDTDIEMNGVNFTFTTDPGTTVARPGTALADLENTVTHELGHVLGLAHTCWDGTTLEPPVDHTGTVIPTCRLNEPQTVKDTTMYPYSDTPGEVLKRTLTTDDVRGVCDVYPLDAPLKACHQRVQGGSACAVGGGGRPALVALLLACVLLLWRRRR